MKQTIKLFGKAWRDRMPAPDAPLPARLEQALRRLAAAEGEPIDATNCKNVDKPSEDDAA